LLISFFFLPKATAEAIQEPKYNFDPSTLSVYDQVTYFAFQEGVDLKLAHAIVKGESNYKNVPNYKYHENPNYWSAYGIFQITRTTYKGFCGDPEERYEITPNIKCGIKILATEGGENHWNPSRHAWKHAL
jgi:hypothetical protein